jgi:hypothetical protein
MTVKLTYSEYKKASDAGLVSGGACACMGPQGDDEWCPCSMSLLNKIVPEDQHILTDEWKANGYLSRSEQQAIWDAERGIQNETFNKWKAEQSVREAAGWANMEKALK